MARNKGKKQTTRAAEQRQSITKLKSRITKSKATKTGAKKKAKKIVEKFENMQRQQLNTSPGKMLQQTKRKSQENIRKLSAFAEKRRKGQDAKQLRSMQATSGSTMMSNTTNVNNNRQPDALKQLPASSNGTEKQQKNGISNNTTQKPAAYTIVIDDSDEEKATATTTQTLFYVDRNPGIREEEVPLYVVSTDVEESVTNDDPHAVNEQSAIIQPDDSVIVLDNTIDQTVNDSMKEMQINVDVETIVLPSSTNTAAVTSSSSSTATSTSNVQSTVAETIISDVIDLSDYSDSEQPCSSYTANTKTPPFPALDRIPLGYSVPKARANNNRAQQKSQKNGKANTKDPPIRELDEEKTMQKKRMVVIDGNNVAFGHLNGKMFSVKGLELCINYFKKLGHEVTAVVPQFKLKRHQSTDAGLLEQLHRQGDVTLAPCKSLPGQFSSSYDDRLILSIAEQFDGVIVSNDNFRDLLDISPAWRRIIETRVIGYSWVKDCFFLPDDPYGRYGPTLKQILNGKSR